MPPKKRTEQPVAAPAEDVEMEEAPAEEVNSVDLGNPSIIKDDDRRIRVVRCAGVYVLERGWANKRDSCRVRLLMRRVLSLRRRIIRWGMR